MNDNVTPLSSITAAYQHLLQLSLVIDIKFRFDPGAPSIPLKFREDTPGLMIRQSLQLACPHANLSGTGIYFNNKIFLLENCTSALLRESQNNPSAIAELFKGITAYNSYVHICFRIAMEFLVNNGYSTVYFNSLSGDETIEKVARLFLKADTSNAAFLIRRVGDIEEQFRLDGSAANFFPCPCQFNLELSCYSLNKFRIPPIRPEFMNAVSDYMSVASSLSTNISEIVGIIQEIHEKSEKPFIFACGPTGSGKTQLGFNLDKFSRHPIKLTNVDPSHQQTGSEPKIGCVLHFRMKTGGNANVVRQPVYNFLKAISTEFLNALESDYREHLQRLPPKHSSENWCISSFAIEELKDVELKTLGFVMHLLGMRLANQPMNLTRVQDGTYLRKPISDVRHFVQENFSDLPAVIVLDEFNPTSDSDIFLTLFYARNLLRLCGFVVIVTGTDVQAANQVDPRNTDGDARIFDVSPWVYIVDRLPNASPSTICRASVFRKLMEPLDGPSRDGLQYLEALLHGSFVKASWSGGLKGVKFDQFLSIIAAEIDLEYHESQLIGTYKHLEDLLKKTVLVFAPTDATFSKDLKEIPGIFTGSVFTVPDNEEVDGYAVPDGDDEVLFSFEGKGRTQKDVGSDLIVPIVKKAIKFRTSNPKVCDRNFSWHVVLVLVDRVVDNLIGVSEIPSNVIMYTVKKHEDVSKPGVMDISLVELYSTWTSTRVNPTVVIVYPLEKLEELDLIVRQNSKPYLFK